MSGLAHVIELPVPHDAELVLAARSGSRSAATELVRRHQPRVRATLRRILGGSVDLADVSQDVFIEALEKLGTLRNASAFAAWVRGIAIMRARQVLRSQRRWGWLTSADSEEAHANASSTGAGSDVTAAASAVYRELGRLDPDERIAFCLARLEGLQLEEIADVSAVSLATVKRRIQRAEAHLAATLASHTALAHYLRSDE